MNPLDQVNSYLNRLERRLRLNAFSRGAALTGIAALLLTVVLVFYANSQAFSEPSLRVARFVLFLSLALAVAFGLAVPLLALNRRRAARRAESAIPEFKDRLLTFAEKHPQSDPFLELLAADTMEVANAADPERIAARKWIFGSASAATVAVAALVWLVLAGPGFWGHGASLLWAGAPRAGMRSAFYDIVVTPGNKSVRKRSDTSVHAELVGFEATKATVHAKFATTSKWEPVPMMPEASGTGWEFLFTGLPETVEYYVEAGGIKSKTFKLTALDLPGIQKLKVSYKYPRWAGLREVVEDPGGDLRAVEGTEATVSIRTDRPLGNAVLILDDGTRIRMNAAGNNWLGASLPLQKDGMYHIATVEGGEDVRLSEDYFIEAQKEQPPVVRITRPGRDFKVSPIEEVTINVEAEDDFGVQDLELRYSVNGGAEKSMPLLKAKGAKNVNGETMISLEEFKLSPGDVVSLYARAKDARTETSTDMLFLEAQPFEREYSQAQQGGGGGGGEEGGMGDGAVTQRQKEIIAATFNQIRDKKKIKSADAENAKFLSDMQGKLRDQSKSLAERMKRRELAGNNQEFQSFARDMQEAAQAMGDAVEKLKSQSWKDAIAPEQKALQHLLRAEATRRQIQVAFGSKGGGGGGGGAGRDLENLFDLELDTEKNQYETGQQMASADQRSREMEEALQKLEQLARRQQELAQQQRDAKQAPQQRWQQEMLRREAEQLQKKMEQIARSQQGQSGQSSSQQGQSGQQSSSSSSRQQQQQQQQQQSRGSQGSVDPRIQQALERIQRATEDMRRASSAQAQGNNAEARRAAERLKEAQDAVRNMRQQESGNQLDDLARRADQLSAQQRDFVNKLKKTFGESGTPQPGTTGTQQQAQSESLAREKEGMLNELNSLEKDMQSASRNLAGSQRNASSKLRKALGDMQQDELRVRMKFGADWLRRGYGAYVAPREAPVTMGLEQLRDNVKQAQAAVGPGGKDEGIEKALSQVEKLREQMARASQAGQQRGQRGEQGQSGQGQQQGQQRGNQQGQGKQPGQQGQQGQQGQGAQQGQGGQQAGNQPGNQPGGNQSGRGQGGQQSGGQGQQGQFGENGGFSGERGGNGSRDPGGLRGAYRSEQTVPAQGSVNNSAGVERAFRESLRELSQLRQSMGDNPEMQREINEVMKEMQKYDPSKFPGNPALLEEMRTQVLPNIEQLELQLRRKLEGTSGNIRSSAAERVPQGYGDAAAEYFRRLSKSK